MAGADSWRSGTTSGLFHDGGNWTDGTAPASSDTVTFDRAGDYEVWWDATDAIAPAD